MNASSFFAPITAERTACERRRHGPDSAASRSSTASACWKRKAYAWRLKRLEQRLHTEQEIRDGYRRLAFGPVTDAVKLLFLEEAPSPGQLEEMDLFPITEIKRPRTGGIEMKFCDRLKALEKLAQLEAQETQENGASFYQALESGARALRGER